METQAGADCGKNELRARHSEFIQVEEPRRRPTASITGVELRFAALSVILRGSQIALKKLNSKFIQSMTHSRNPNAESAE